MHVTRCKDAAVDQLEFLHMHESKNRTYDIPKFTIWGDLNNKYSY